MSEAYVIDHPSVVILSTLLGARGLDVSSTSYRKNADGSAISLVYGSGAQLKLTKVPNGGNFCEYHEAPGARPLSKGKAVNRPHKAEIDAATAQIAFALAELGLSVRLSLSAPQIQ